IQIDGLCHDIRYINLLRHAREFSLHRRNSELNLLNKLLEILRGLEVARAREPLKLLDDTQRSLGNRLFSLGTEKRLLRGPTAVPCNLSQNHWRNLNNFQVAVRDITPNDDARADDRVGLVRFVDNLLEAIMRDDGQAVHSGNAHSFAVGKSQATPNRLLHECL